MCPILVARSRVSWGEKAAYTRVLLAYRFEGNFITYFDDGQYMHIERSPVRSINIGDEQEEGLG